jgi:hypothetical protein
MRQTILLIFVLGAVVGAFSACAHIADPCHNGLLNRSPSPDGSLVASVYSRECPSKLYTYIAIEKRPRFFEKRGEPVCHLVNWGGKHPVEVVWKDRANIFVGTSDELSDLDLGGVPKEVCASIHIDYAIPGYPRQPLSDEPVLGSVPDMIRLVLQDIGPCIDAFARKGDPNLDIIADIERYAKVGPTSMAVGLMIRFSSAADCKMTDATRKRMVKLSELYRQMPLGSKESADREETEIIDIRPAQPN